MATAGDTSAGFAIPTKSHDTALCVIPPNTDCGDIDRLRELYDKSYGSWPAHVNLIYPFVSPDVLPRAQEQIQAHFDRNLDHNEAPTTTFQGPGLFKHRNNSTVFLQETGAKSTSCLTNLRSMALQALGQKDSASHLHLTIGQTSDNTLFAQQFLLSKARLLPALRFRIGALAILVRERAANSDSAATMRLWGIIRVARSEDLCIPQTPEHWIDQHLHRPPVTDDNDDSELLAAEQPDFSREVQPGPTYHYDTRQDRWVVHDVFKDMETLPRTVTVASYNVLIDSEYPPARERDPHVLRTILADSATADILVLQEVSDDFLSYLLQDEEMRRRFPFTSHGLPDQSDIGPLSSLRNVVTLSQWPFKWTFVPFHRRHKGALVATFPGLVKHGSSGHQDLIVVGIHLTCGLTDGSVAAKRVQVQNLLSYLSCHHSTEPWIVTGDFNLTTSTYTINTALKDKSISSQTVLTLTSIETAMHEADFVDAWAVAHVEAKNEVAATEELFEGEEGATFDPRNNILAAETSGTSIRRPQRYDRVLFRSQDALQVSSFNHFGLPEEIDGAHVVPSDHYGIRARFKLLKTSPKIEGDSDQHSSLPDVKCIRAIAALAGSDKLEKALADHGMFPSEEVVHQRQQAFALLKQVVLGTTDDDGSALADIPLVMVPVGSYALGAWTSASDIDCLCIGTVSSRTFFRLIRQRLIKADGQGVRILRRVEAGTGIMLELLVNGVAMDLQYCPAARVVERWSEFSNLPASDPVFNLSILSLRKLKPYRDLLYIKRTLPSLSAFRLAYRCIKLWAVQRGIYSSKFGYLGGVHITLILSWVSKSIAHDHGSATAADLVVSFFHYFAHFDWANEMLYDAFFHQTLPRYHRSSREPMVVLGYHAPNSNIAHTATVPGLQTLVKEVKAATELFSDRNMTWDQFFGSVGNSQVGNTMDVGAASFLQAHTSYVKIDIQFWGRTLAKGKSLVGWVESRCFSLVVDIYRALPDLEVRIWPARFTDLRANDEWNDYHGCYLIGLSKSSDAVPLRAQEDRLLAKQTLDKTIDRFLTQLKTDEKNYDASTCWIGMSVAGPHDVRSLRLDDREWGDYTLDMEADSDDEEDEEDFSDEPPEALKRTIPQRPKPTATPVSTSKLRPASDVINRLRWDPALDPADYIVGYEDRFLGAKETSLEKWKTEQTDEEFIPQHRVLYFKKRGCDGNGELVWERVTRIDKVFGSGIGAGHGKSVDAVT